MSMDQLMALVPIEAAKARSTTGGRKSRWERATKSDKKSHTRWGAPEDRPYLPPPFVDLPPGLTSLQVDQFLREQRLEELSRKLRMGELEYGDPDIRPPSPPPVYDRNGTRTNTRDVRVRAAMTAEHQRLVEYVARTIPGYAPPADFKPAKKVKRIMIPQDKYPEYNFMGLIIGPRGCNHKRLEAESGAQISIRGKGTQKEGKRTDHQTDEEASMPQHVHIAADTEEKLEKAVNLIEPLLDPFHPMHEEFKKRGLEQLALVNGVGVGALSKTDQRCHVCGALGHLGWECPEQQFQSFKRAEVKCALCGDMGHVTMDCKIARERNMTLDEVKALEAQKKAESDPNASGVVQTNGGGGGPAGIGAGGGGRPFPGPQPPPPPFFGMRGVVPGNTFDRWRMDQEYDRMMAELVSGDSAAPQGESQPTKDTMLEELDDLPHGPPRPPGQMAPPATPPPGETRPHFVPQQPQAAFPHAPFNALGSMPTIVPPAMLWPRPAPATSWTQPAAAPGLNDFLAAMAQPQSADAAAAVAATLAGAADGTTMAAPPPPPVVPTAHEAVGGTTGGGGGDPPPPPDGGPPLPADAAAAAAAADPNAMAGAWQQAAAAAGMMGQWDPMAFLALQQQLLVGMMGGDWSQQPPPPQ